MKRSSRGLYIFGSEEIGDVKVGTVFPQFVTGFSFCYFYGLFNGYAVEAADLQDFCGPADLVSLDGLESLTSARTGSGC